MDKNERRHSPRQNSQAPIQVIFFSGDSKSGEDRKSVFPGKMCNQSQDGLCIEMDRFLQPGSSVRIEIACEPDSGLEKVCYIRDGSVRWCETLAAPVVRFAAGIKILRKVVRAPVLTSRFVRPTR